MFATITAFAAAFAASINLTALAVVVTLTLVYIPLLSMIHRRWFQWKMTNFTIRQCYYFSWAVFSMSLAYVAVIWYLSNWQTVVVWAFFELTISKIVSKITTRLQKVKTA